MKQKKLINSIINDLEGIWQKIYQKEPLDHYDLDKLSSIIGSLKEINGE